MKLSCLPVSFFPLILGGEMSIADWARLAARAGLDAVDLSALFFREREVDAARTREEIEGAGLSVAVFNTYPDLTHPRAEERARQMKMLRGEVQLAGELGARMVRVTAGQAHPETGRKQGVDLAVEGLRRAAAWAERFGTALAYENHSQPGIWDYPDFSYPGEIFLEIAGRLEGSGVEVLFDTANPVTRGEDPLAILDRVADRLICVHVADTARAGAMEWVRVGTGAVPIREVFAVLQARGYDGWLSIEEASGLGPEGVEESVAFVREAWAEASARVAG